VVRETSIEAYHSLLSSGWIARKNQEVYRVFFEHGPLTSAECYSLLGWKGSDQRGNVRARVHELKNDGYLKEIGKRVCSVTQNTVYFYDVTSKCAEKRPKPTKIECPHCKGTGFLAIQGRLL